ncbi:MAG: 3-phosphoshikimate 1-carboxyvinyltransferase [Eubacterium sp.]|nr:3-phosphoshikimate 1-carboxyvinyltransferase [Eubacterium sp.]
MIIKPVKRVGGEITPPADKSISHRAVMFGAIADGTTHIENCLLSADCLSTIGCFRQLGIDIAVNPDDCTVAVHGKGIDGLSAASETLDVGNSGTTTRLISGILSGQGFSSTLSGDASLNSRPMKRIMTPLTQMGAKIESVNDNGCAPLKIEPSELKGIAYDSPIASAQVKSCVLLAGLYADGETTVTEPSVSRDHTERMLKAFGADIEHEGIKTVLRPGKRLFARDITVPADISSAAYFIAAALTVRGSELTIKNVSVNETRAGILSVCEKMGAVIKRENEREISGEPVCDLIVKASKLCGTVIEGDIIPALIDEIPIICVMAATAEGQTVIRDAADLKNKESDRIKTTCEFLSAMGAQITSTGDGMIITGVPSLNGAKVKSYDDHRIAMSAAVAALNASGPTEIENGECVKISYPAFYEDLGGVCVD